MNKDKSDGDLLIKKTSNDDTAKVPYDPYESNRQMVCRICLSEEEPENHLICPCKCSGSMG